MDDELLTEIVRRVLALEKWRDDFKLPETLMRVSRANVSNPPTDAELDGIYGTPAVVGAGFNFIVDDNGAGSNVWFVVTNGATWWYEALTLAV